MKRVARGAALLGEVASTEAADRAFRLAVASLPEDTLVENNLRVELDVEPLRVLLANDPELRGVRVQRLARGVALAGEVASVAAADRALRLAAASLSEGMLVENNLSVGLDLGPLRALMASQSGFHAVRVQRVGRGVALTGDVATAATSERAFRLAVASLPEGMLVENNLRVVLDVNPLRRHLATEPSLSGVTVQRLARGVALTGEVDSVEASERALRLAAASLPEGTLVENNLRVELDLLPLRTLILGEPDLHDVRVKPVARGVALTGEVGSADAAERALRLAVASLPADMLIESNLRVVLDVEPLRTLLAGEPDLQGVRVQRLARGAVLAGHVHFGSGRRPSAPARRGLPSGGHAPGKRLADLRSTADQSRSSDRRGPAFHRRGFRL